MPTDHWLIIRNTSGVKMAQFTSFERLAYTNAVNEVGLCEFVLRGDHPALTGIDRDYRVDVYRANAAMGLGETLDYTGFLRWRQYQTGDRTTFTARAFSPLVLLRDRDVAYYEGHARSTYTATAAETVMNTLVSYNACANATTGNGRKRDGAITGLTVEADGGDGETVDWYCHGQNLLSTLQKLAEISGGAFDVVATSATAYQFRYYDAQRGTDRTATVAFALERGNMEKPVVTFDDTDTATAAIVWGKGQGSGRAVAIRTSADYHVSTNNREMTVNSNTDTLDSEGDAALAERRRRHDFEFDVRQTPGCFYGVHYTWGDLVTAVYGGTTYTMQVRSATVTRDEDGAESVSVGMRRT